MENGVRLHPRLGAMDEGRPYRAVLPHSRCMFDEDWKQDGHIEGTVSSPEHLSP